MLAVTLHAGVVALLLHSWEPERNREVTIVEPLYIDASVVRENPHRAKKEREKAEADRKNRIRKKKEADRQALIKKDRLAKAKKQAEVEAKQEAERIANSRIREIPREEPEPPPETSSEDERLLMEKALALAIQDEQEYRKAVTDDEKAMAYVAQIKREIGQNWSRPPSARNGMQAVLRVFLVPTGDVVNVTVEDSSGNEAFDRSAVLAVQKTERFVVPDDSRQFERNFREFEIVFRPEDLRL